MKKLPLSNPGFLYLEQSFREWLDILGYAPGTVYDMPVHVRELLYYMEQQGYTHISALTAATIETHYERLKTRSHQRRGGGLSNAHLNKHMQSLKKFTEYLRKTGRQQTGPPALKHEESGRSVTFLSEAEISELFRSTRKAPEKKGRSMTWEQAEALQGRDRAMLAVYYGCGLRRNEGVQLNVSDISFEKSLLHVTKGKNYKERLVPVSKSSLKTLTGYIYDHRPELLRGRKTEALFVSLRGRRMQGQSLLLRLKYLQQQSDSTTLREKEIGLHTLRHSIATHLLSAGMKLESISRFLGHSSLESTQIYTHLSAEASRH